MLTTVGGETKYRSIKAIKNGGRLAWISSEDPSGPKLERGIECTMFYARAEASSLNIVADLIDEGRLSPFIEEVFPLEDATKAQQKVASGRARGKIVLSIA